jgi:hypothetical protein
MNTQNDQYSNQQDITEHVKAVKQAHENELLAKKNVVGVGIGFRQIGGTATSDLALVVMVTKKLPASQLSEDDFVPSKIDGVPVDVQEVGEITAY